METIILKKDPKIEFQLRDNGFELVDGQTKENSGFYAYEDVQSIELNKVWFPGLAKWMRIMTWVLNGVPYFQDAKSYKKANIIIQCSNAKIGIWLTTPYMARKARKSKVLLYRQLKHNAA